MPEVASELSPEAKNLAAKAMLGRALVKLQRYTAHRAVRAEKYRLARRQWYLFRLKVSFRKMVANVDDEEKRRLKVQESVLRCNVRKKKTCLRRWYDTCAPNIEAINMAKKSHEERLKRNAIICLRRMRQNTLLRLRKATKCLRRKKLKRHFGAWASVVAIASTYRQLDSIAKRHFESSLRRATLHRWVQSHRIIVGENKIKALRSDNHFKRHCVEQAFRAWNCRVAEWREDRERTQTATLHRAVVVRRSAFSTWRMFAYEVASEKQRVRKANDFLRSKIATAAVRVWGVYTKEAKTRKRNAIAADKLHARHVVTSALRGWKLYFREELRMRETVLRDEEMSRAKAIEESSIINISSGIADGNARVIVKAKRPAPRTADDYLMIEGEDVGLTGSDNTPDELPQLLLPWSVIENGQNRSSRYEEAKITPNALSPSKSVITRLDPPPSRTAKENMPVEQRRRELFAKYSKRLVELNEQASQTKLPDLKLLVEIERMKQKKAAKYKVDS